MRKIGVGTLAAVALLFIGGMGEAAKFRYQYAAKFVCGFDPPGAFVRVAPGQYATTVAVHNPQGDSVTIRKKVALTFPPAAQAPGEVSAWLYDEVASDHALQIDCEEIGGHPPPGVTDSEFFPGRNLFGSGFPPYIQGFVVIESSASVDVTLVMSIADLGEAPGERPGAGRSVDVERVHERRIHRDDDGDNDDDSGDDHRK